MSHPAAATKVSQFIEEQLIDTCQNWIDRLLLGQLLDVETQVYEFSTFIFERLMRHVVQGAAGAFCELQEQDGPTGLARRTSRVTIRSGVTIAYPSMYRKRLGSEHRGSRHLLDNH